MAGRRQSRGGAAQPKKIWLLIGIAAVMVILAVALVVSLSGKDKTEGEKEETPTKQEEASDTPQNTGAQSPENEKPPVDRSEAASSVSEEQVDGKWNLLLVNPWNPIPDGFSVELENLDNGSVDKRCYPQLLDNQISAFRNQGYDEDEAYRLAAREVAVPGTSEHQLGLAVDIIDASNWNLDESQEHTPAQQWLMANSWRYGFILRYPNDKSDITGIIYEPWHYRYVGYDVAKEIHERGICLEEYLGRAGH